MLQSRGPGLRSPARRRTWRCPGSAPSPEIQTSGVAELHIFQLYSKWAIGFRCHTPLARALREIWNTRHANASRRPWSPFMADFVRFPEERFCRVALSTYPTLGPCVFCFRCSPRNVALAASAPFPQVVAIPAGTACVADASIPVVQFIGDDPFLGTLGAMSPAGFPAVNTQNASNRFHNQYG